MPVQKFSAESPPRLYFSSQGLPLVFYGDPPHQPTLTVENYIKWYTLHVVYPDGVVEALSCDDWLWDHVPHPAFCEALVAEDDKHRDKLVYPETCLAWDPQSLDMVLGRWMLEHENYDAKTSAADCKEFELARQQLRQRFQWVATLPGRSLGKSTTLTERSCYRFRERAAGQTV